MDQSSTQGQSKTCAESSEELKWVNSDQDTHDEQALRLPESGTSEQDSFDSNQAAKVAPKQLLHLDHHNLSLQIKRIEKEVHESIQLITSLKNNEAVLSKLVLLKNEQKLHDLVEENKWNLTYNQILLNK